MQRRNFSHDLFLSNKRMTGRDKEAAEVEEEKTKNTKRNERKKEGLEE